MKKRYDDWQDLMGYCTRSASPVGRYLIDLHGGSDNGYGPSDALCNALQVINHLQDCKEDYLTLDRVYLPGDWMGEEGMDVEALAKDRSSRPVRRVINRTLSATEDLMDEAWTLPVGLRSRRLAMDGRDPTYRRTVDCAAADRGPACGPGRPDETWIRLAMHPGRYPRCLRVVAATPPRVIRLGRMPL